MSDLQSSTTRRHSSPGELAAALRSQPAQASLPRHVFLLLAEGPDTFLARLSDGSQDVKKRQRPAALKIYGLTRPYVKSGEMGPALKATIKYISIRAVCSCNTCFNLMGSRQMNQAVIWKIISKRLTLSLSSFGSFYNAYFLFYFWRAIFIL